MDESDETFSVTISSPSGGGGPAPVLGTSSIVTTTITDDDDAPSDITLSVIPTIASVRPATTTLLHGDGYAGRDPAH